jgi:hypothetical protein
MIRIFIVKFTSRLNIWAMTINGALCRARHKVLLLPKPLVLMDDLGELLPHLPALRPPQLLDLAAGVLMGHKLLPPSLDNAPDVLDWLRFRFCYGFNWITLQN